RNPGTGFFFGTRTGTTNNTTTGPSDDYTGGGKYIYTEASGGTNGDTATITTPDIDLSTLTDPYMTFYYHMFGADITSLEVEVSNDGGLTWVNEASIVGQQQTASADYWRDQPLDLSAYTGDVIQVRFLTVKAGFNADLAIDEIEIDEAPTCPKPTNLDTTNITDTEITVDWTNGGTETNWNIEYGPTGFTQGTGTTVPVTTNPFNITGLTPDTGYDIYIQADCGGGDLSDWTFPINVTTECSDEIAPYLQPFNSGTQPNCWDNTSSNTTSANALWKFTGTPGYGATANGRPAGSYAWTDGSTPIVNDVTLLSPNIDMSTLTVPMLSFDWFSNNEDNPGDNVPLIIDVHDGTSWTNLITLSGDSPDWQDVEITLGAYIGQTVKFRFICDQTATSGLAQYNDILLDSVLIDEAPTCPKPITLDVSNVTANDVDVDWTQGYQETEWIIEYDTTGFLLGTGNTMTTNNLSEVITGLTELTDYEVYIRAICSPGDTSDYTGPVSFTTACDVYPAPFYEPFDNGVQPDCWDNQATGSANIDFWLFDGAPGYGATSNGKPVDTYAWSDGSGGEPEGTLITPFIDLTTINDPYLTFEWFSNNTNFPGDNVPLYIEINGGSVWTPLDTLQGDDPNWLEEAYDLSAYEDSIVRIRFITDHTATINSAFYNDILVDDVHVWPCNAEPSVDGALDECVLEDSVNLNDVITITPQPLDTKWSFPTSPSLIANDSILVITTLPAGTYPVYYIVEAACTSDTTVANITVYPAHQAGPNGSVTVCLNEPVDLSDGLSGNYDLGGNWYDPYDTLMPDPHPTTPAIPTTYNYDYITTTNSVCPVDTALIELIVDGDCDFLLIDGENLSNIKVYPNPTSDIINIENTSDSESLQIELLDMNGRVVLSDSRSLDNASKAEIAIDHLQKGIYALRIFNSDGQHTFRIVKQ
ncbi:MAG: T9SS type A sorting domain-containing protein, partial [Brumimicrobium sp.]